MASNSIGTLFRITTAGESHGAGYTVIIDGCPSGIEISLEQIHKELSERQAKGWWSTARQEADQCEILSGLYQGKTTGAPIALWIANKEAQSSSYQSVNSILRPSHAQFTYEKKYGIFDPYGGGRASGRETVCRVAAGAFAKAFLEKKGVRVAAFVSKIGPLSFSSSLEEEIPFWNSQVRTSRFGLLDPSEDSRLEILLKDVIEKGDSIGGAVGFAVDGLPAGWGDPVYDKLHSKIAYYLLSIPSTKGITFGSGIEGAEKRGSEHNDPFYLDSTGNVRTRKNDHGGVLGGISSAERLYGNLYLKAPSSISIPTESIGGAFAIPNKERHDPTTTIRARKVVESMIFLALADAALMQQSQGRV